MAECILIGNGDGGYDVAFSNNGYFQYPANIIIPSNVTTLAAADSRGGFYKHTELETISFESPSTITALSNSLCDGCTSLVSFDMPPNITIINQYAFRNTAIREITIPSGVTTIGQYAFYGCPLSDITWNTGNSQVILESYAFSHSGITDTVYSTIINRSYKTNTYLFEYCDNLRNIVVPRTASYMFQYCTGLLSAALTDGDARHSTSQYLFRGCTALMTVTIVDTIKTISGSCFYGCSALTNVGIPNTLTTIESNAFQNCTSLQTIALPSTITSLNSNAFSGCSSLTDIVLGSNWNCSCSFSAVTTLTASSLVAMLTSLADLTGGTAKTLTLGATNLSKLTAEEKMIALNKNWNLA